MAQESLPAPAAEAVAEITPLEVGDRVPEELWDRLFPVVSTESDQVQHLSLGDFRDKLIILDFWATWCGSCISSLHELGGLQEQFKGDLQVVPIAYEPKSKVGPFLTKQEIGLPSVIEDTELKGYFPHNSVPHQVWIKDNAVRAIVRHEETSAENIEKLLAGGDIRLQGKRDILDYDAFSNILEYAERTETPVLSTSSFTGRIEGLPASMGTRSEGGLTVVNYTNVNPLLMYSRAMGVRNNRIIVNSENLRKAANIDGDTRIRYSYQLVISGGADERMVNRRVLSDLNAQFDVRVDSQIVDMDCYVISRISESGDDPLPDAAGSRSSGNGKISHEFTALVNLLNFSIKWTADQPIFIDRSGFRGKVEGERYEVLQKDVDRLKLALIPHGLTVTREKQPIKMYVINDADQSDAAN